MKMNIGKLTNMVKGHKKTAEKMAQKHFPGSKTKAMSKGSKKGGRKC